MDLPLLQLFINIFLIFSPHDYPSRQQNASVHVYCVPADGQCYEYKWMASAWKGSSRTVWCQRSDGINVTGKLPISLFFKSLPVTHIQLVQQNKETKIFFHYLAHGWDSVSRLYQCNP